MVNDYLIEGVSDALKGKKLYCGGCEHTIDPDDLEDLSVSKPPCPYCNETLEKISEVYRKAYTKKNLGDSEK